MIHVKPRPITQKRTYNLRWLESNSQEINLSGIAVSSEGQIAVCDQGCNRLIILNEDGVFKETIGRSGRDQGEFSLPDGVAYNKNNHLLVSDYGNHRIQMYDERGGKFCSTFGTGGSADGQLNFPCGLSVDDNGNVIVSDWGNKRVQVFDERGHFKFKFSSHATSCDKSLGCRDSLSGMIEPQHCIAFKNSFFVSDSSDNCVKVFNEFGMFLYNFGCMDSPQGLMISDRDILCVCDSNNGCINLYYLDGDFITNFPSLSWPMYLAKGKNGEVFVTERGACQVTVLKLP
ncbi:hypothetical protein ACROYT_G016960 [Oculina patagonica]